MSAWGFLDDIPIFAHAKAVYDTGDDVIHGRWKSALGNGVDAISPTTGFYNIGQKHIEGDEGGIGGGMIPDAGHGIANAYQAIKNAVNGPYDEKKKGYDAIAAEIAKLKQERMGQKDFAYNLANSKYDNTRSAIQSVYGDPKGWKL